MRVRRVFVIGVIVVGLGYAAASAGADPASEPPRRDDELPVPSAPPEPDPPSSYLAPRDEPAGRIARVIAHRAQQFHNFRAETPGATWRTTSDAVWRIRPEDECLAELRDKGIAARPRPKQRTPVPTPVELLGPVNGVWFRSTHTDRPLLMSCEMAARLPALAQVLRDHGIGGVDVMSALRDHPYSSYHTMGLGLDLQRFWTGEQWVSVLRDFEITAGQHTCEASHPDGSRAAILLRIACDIAETNRFSTILTPNYNEGHRDHFHLDARPADPRVFLK